MSVVSTLKEVFGNNEPNNSGNYTDKEVAEIVAVDPRLLTVLAAIAKEKEKAVKEEINVGISESIKKKRSLDYMSEILRREPSEVKSKKNDELTR